MLNLTDIASLEKARKQREAARRMQESQRGESVMWRRPEAEWLPDYQRPGGHALEAPMFSPDDLIGSGVSKPIMVGAKALAASAPAAALMGMAKNAGKSSLADVVREAGVGGFKSPGLPEAVERTVAVPLKGRGNALKSTDEGKKIYEGTDAIGSITPQRLGKMRNDYYEHMGKGAIGKNWYEDSSDYIFRVTGEKPAAADNLANAYSITSSRTTVPPNLMYGNKGWNQYLVGDEVLTGGFPNVMGPQIRAAFDNPGASASGLKRSPFSAGLSVAWRGKDFASRPTHDIHDMRAWGITNPKTGELWDTGVPPAAHRFLDDQADVVTARANKENLGGSSDWRPYNAQAAAWLSQKAKREGKDIGETAQSYAHFAPDYQGQIAREWQPSTRTPHLSELQGAPYDVRNDFANTLEGVNTGPQGLDRLALGMGALTDRTLPNVGIYEGVNNPGFLSQIGVGKLAGPQTYAEQAMDPASERVMRSVAAAHGLVGVQDQVGYNYLTSKAAKGGPAGQSNAFQINYGGPMSGESMNKAAEDLGNLGVHLPLNDPRGVRGLNFGGEGQTTDFFPPDVRKALQAHAKDTGGELRWLNNSGNILPASPSASWSAKPYVAEIEAGGPRMVENFNNTMQGGFASEMLSAVQSQAQKHGLTAAPYYEPMMSALSSGGLPALKDLIAKGVVPVTVLGVLGLNHMMGDTQGAYD